MVNSLPTAPRVHRSPRARLLSFLQGNSGLRSGCSKLDAGYVPRCVSPAGAMHYSAAAVVGFPPSPTFSPEDCQYGILHQRSPTANKVRTTPGIGSTISAGGLGNSHGHRCFSGSS